MFSDIDCGIFKILVVGRDLEVRVSSGHAAARNINFPCYSVGCALISCVGGFNSACNRQEMGQCGLMNLNMDVCFTICSIMHGNPYLELSSVPFKFWHSAI